MTDVDAAPFRKTRFIETSVRRSDGPDGIIYLRAVPPLGGYPHRATARLEHWARLAPDRIFLARRSAPPPAPWTRLTYAETYARVRRIAQALLDRRLSAEQPVVMLSENSIEHGLLALAALHVGIPHAPVSPAYSLKSTDFKKLRHVLENLTPGLIFVQNGKQYKAALHAVAGNAEIVCMDSPPENRAVTFFSELEKTAATSAVAQAHAAIRPETPAKILFTSGSTGFPKGVLNTHENLCANWQQIAQTFPFFSNEGGFTLVDWLPWSHTFGGNHNFGFTLYSGGTFYIDDGNPSPAGIRTTAANLAEIAPTAYFNVPRGFEELIAHLQRDTALRERFFSRLEMLFYAGAGMSQHVWDGLEKLAVQTTGQRVPIIAGLGCTESSPAALIAARAGGFAGMLGVPVPGLELKLVPQGDKLEARYRGKNICPGYWRNPEASLQAFDEEGFYRTGDALKFVNPDDPDQGLLFDGRLAEDFKLDTGTWVNAGVLRTQLIAASGGLIQDVVITGQNRGFVGAIVFPNLDFLKKSSDTEEPAGLTGHPAALAALQEVLDVFSARSTGSSNWVRRALFADFALSIDAGEVTDKGSINPWAVQANRAETVTRIYAENIDSQVVETKNLPVWKT